MLNVFACALDPSPSFSSRSPFFPEAPTKPRSLRCRGRSIMKRCCCRINGVSDRSGGRSSWAIFRSISPCRQTVTLPWCCTRVTARTRSWRSISPARAVVSRISIDESFYGLAFSPDGSRVFCSGAGDEVLHEFAFKDGFLSDPKDHALRDPKLRGIPAGIAVASDGTLYAANLWGQSISRVRPGEAPEELPLAGAHAAPTARAATTDERSITKRADAEKDPTAAGDPFPYGCVLDEKSGRLFVSLWGQAQVAVIDTKTFKLIARWADGRSSKRDAAIR